MEQQGTSKNLKAIKPDYKRHVIGSDENELLIGDKYNNLLQGNKGLDHFKGGKGQDTYFFNIGDSLGKIERDYLSVERIDDPSFNNIISFGEGIFSKDVKMHRLSNHRLLIQYSDRDYFTIDYDAIETLMFSDGSKIDINQKVLESLPQLGLQKDKLTLGMEKSHYDYTSEDYFGQNITDFIEDRFILSSNGSVSGWYTSWDEGKNTGPVIAKTSDREYYSFTDLKNATIRIPKSDFVDFNGDQLTYSLGELKSNPDAPDLKLSTDDNYIYLTGSIKSEGPLSSLYWLNIEDGRGNKLQHSLRLTIGNRAQGDTSRDYYNKIIGSIDGSKITIGLFDWGIGQGGNNQFSLKHTVQDDVNFTDQAKGEWSLVLDIRVGEYFDGNFQSGTGNDTYHIDKGQRISIVDKGGDNVLVFGKGLKKEDIRLVNNDGAYTIHFKDSRTKVRIVNLGDGLSDSAFYKLFSEFRFANGDVIKRDNFPIMVAPTALKGNGIYTISNNQSFEILDLFTREKVLSHRPDNYGEGFLLNRDYEVIDVTVNGKPLPSWMRFDANTGILSGESVVSQEYAQSHLTFALKDTKTGLVSYIDRFVEFAFGVSNTPPQLNSPLVDSDVELFQERDGFIYQFERASFIDHESNVLTYNVTLADGRALPSWLKFDSETLTLTGNASNEIDKLALKITAKEPSGQTASFIFNLNVSLIDQSDNRAPIIQDKADSLIYDEKAEWSYELPKTLFSDPDGDALSYKITLADGSSLPSWLTFDASNLTLKGRAANQDVGLLQLKITATDPKGLYVSQDFSITINNVNDAPEAIGNLVDQEIELGKDWNYLFPADSFVDVDLMHDDKLTYSYTMADGSSNPSWLKIDANTGLLSGNPSSIGSYNLIIKASDRSGESATHDLTLNIIDKTGQEPGNEIFVEDGQYFVTGTNNNDIIRGNNSGSLIHAGEGDDTIYGGVGNDRIFGDGGNNHLSGGKGDDYLVGGDGNSLYSFNKGDGKDTVFASKREIANSSDIIRFNDVAFSEVLFYGEDNDLIINYGDQDSIRIQGFFSGTGAHLIDAIEFTDQTLTLQDLQKIKMPLQLTGNSSGILKITLDGDYEILGSNKNDHIILNNHGNNQVLTGDGDDYIIGSSGDDILSGGDGDDYINGSRGDDILVGGKGDDYLMGGLGSDTYIFASGDGHDTIYNYMREDQSSTDRIQFVDIASNAVHLTRDGDNLKIQLDVDNSVNVQDYFISKNHKIDLVEFSDKKLTSSEIDKLIEGQGLKIDVSREQGMQSLMNAMATFGGDSSSSVDIINSVDRNNSDNITYLAANVFIN